jgi:hypothetical protein
MNNRISILWLIATLAFNAPTQPVQKTVFAKPASQSLLLFRNGDLLYGNLQSIDSHGTVLWQHPDTTKPIDFRRDSIARIDFPAPADSRAVSDNACRVLLANGNLLEGNLLSCNPQILTLQTVYAGNLNIPRPALQSLVFPPHLPGVFDGITGLDGWTQGAAVAAFVTETGHWTYRNSAFYTDKPASIARDLKLPDTARIQFDLAWKGGLNFAVALYTDSLQPLLLTAKDDAPNFGGFYSLRFLNSAFIDLWPVKKREPVRELGQLFLPSLNNKTHMRVDLRISKSQHKIALFLDDTPVKEWVDPEGFIGEGTGMRFVQNSTAPLKLSNLRVTQWDGVLANTVGETGEIIHDTVWLEHSPQATGSIESIANGKLTVKTAAGPVQFSLPDIRAIDFAHKPASPRQPQALSVHATFAHGGGLDFILESWLPGEITGHNDDLGTIQINPTAFTRLQFLAPETPTSEKAGK